MPEDKRKQSEEMKVKEENQKQEKKQQQLQQEKPRQESQQHQKQQLQPDPNAPKVPQIEVSDKPPAAGQLTRHPLMCFGPSIPINDLLLLRAAEKVAQIKAPEVSEKDQDVATKHIQPTSLSSQEVFDQECRRRQHLQLLDLRFQRQMQVAQKIEALQKRVLQQRSIPEAPRIRQTALSRRYISQMVTNYIILRCT